MKLPLHRRIAQLALLFVVAVYYKLCETILIPNPMSPFYSR